MPAEVLGSGIELILWAQRLGDWLQGPMEFFSFLGTVDFYLIFLPFVYWIVAPRLGFRLSLIMLLSASANTAFKLWLHDPRPFWVDPRVAALSFEQTFGIPSGHAQNSLALLGVLAYTIRRWWAWVSAGILTLLISFSRIYLGVHFPTDVLAGWLFGLLVLGLFLVVAQRVDFQVGKRGNVGILLLSAAVLSFGILAVGVGAVASLENAGWEPPSSWPANASQAFPEEPFAPLSLEDLVGGTAALFGLAAGRIWILSRGGFEGAGPWWQRGVRILLGSVGLVGLVIVTRVVLPSVETVAVLSLRFAITALAGFWLSGLAPAVFIGLGLDTNTPKE